MARKETLLRLRNRLVQQRDALRHKLFADDWSLEDTTHGDAADLAYGDNEQEMHSQLAALESRELRRLEAAITALDEGRYGTCEYCQGKIPLARLKAIPDATTCVGCQQKHELSGGDSRHAANWESAWRFEVHEHDSELTVQDVQLRD